MCYVFLIEGGDLFYFVNNEPDLLVIISNEHDPFFFECGRNTKSPSQIKERDDLATNRYHSREKFRQFWEQVALSDK